MTNLSIPPTDPKKLAAVLVVHLNSISPDYHLLHNNQLYLYNYSLNICLLHYLLCILFRATRQLIERELEHTKVPCTTEVMAF